MTPDEAVTLLLAERFQSVFISAHQCQPDAEGAYEVEVSAYAWAAHSGEPTDQLPHTVTAGTVGHALAEALVVAGLVSEDDAEATE